jgi:hypothetical protein
MALAAASMPTKSLMDSNTLDQQVWLFRKL